MDYFYSKTKEFYESTIDNIVQNRIFGGNITIPFLMILIKRGIIYQINIGDIFLEEEENSKLVKEQLVTIEKSLQIIKETMDNYHKDNWDFYLTKIDTYYQLGIMINYPKITIKNSSNESHNIKNLLVYTIIKFNGKIFLSCLKGSRSTLTFKEWSTGYLQSHLPSTYILDTEYMFYFRNFCTGSGEINDVMDYIKNDGITQELFELFILTLKSTVSWESLEGVPHIKMSSISSENTYNNYLRYNSLDRSLCYEIFKSNFTASDVIQECMDILKFEFKNGKIHLRKTRELEDYIINFIFSANRTFYSNLILKNTSTGIKFLNKKINCNTNPPSRVKNVLDKFLILKGQKIYFKILNKELEDITKPNFITNTHYLNKNFYDFFCEKISNEIRREYLYSRGIKHYSESTNH